MKPEAMYGEAEYRRDKKALEDLLARMTDPELDRYWEKFERNEGWDGEVELQLGAAQSIRRVIGEDEKLPIQHFESQPQFTIDAAELGLMPGSWPLVVEYEGVPFAKGDVRRGVDGDVLWVDYDSGESTFRVWND